jgi:transposase
MYIKHCKLSKNKQLELMKYFIAGATARTVADLVGIHRNSAVRFFHELRVKIAFKQQDRNEQFSGTVELDESYFGGVRKDKRGRGAAGKVAVFGILKEVVKFILR